MLLGRAKQQREDFCISREFLSHTEATFCWLEDVNVPTASSKDRSPDGTDGLMKRTSSLCLFQLTALEPSSKSRNDEWGLREAELLWKSSGVSSSAGRLFPDVGLIGTHM